MQKYLYFFYFLILNVEIEQSSYQPLNIDKPHIACYPGYGAAVPVNWVIMEDHGNQNDHDGTKL